MQELNLAINITFLMLIYC